MNLTEKPDTIQWPETHYVFIEKIGPFQQNAPQAWAELHKLLPALAQHNQISAYFSLYQVETKVYRAGVGVAAPPKDLPAGLAYEKSPAANAAASFSPAPIPTSAPQPAAPSSWSPSFAFPFARASTSRTTSTIRASRRKKNSSRRSCSPSSESPLAPCAATLAPAGR